MSAWFFSIDTEAISFGCAWWRQLKLLKATRMRFSLHGSLGAILASAVFSTALAIPSMADTLAGPNAATEPAAQDQKESPEIALIRKGAAEFEQAFNSGNATAVAALWTPDGEFINDEGERHIGREAIGEAYKKILATSQGQKIKVQIDSIRLLSDSAAIEDGHAVLEPTPLGITAVGRYTVVHVKTNGKWLMSSVRDSRVEASSVTGKLSELEWMIGSWVAEEQGSRVESVCSWIANKSFIQRTYSTTRADQSTTSGLQIIGYNPQGDHLQSWNFSSDGGYAVGIWTRSGDQWISEFHGVLPTGQNTKAFNSITRLDGNAYSWQSMQRMIDGIPVADTDEVVVKRQTK